MSKRSERYPVTYSKLTGKAKQMFVWERGQLIKFNEFGTHAVGAKAWKSWSMGEIALNVLK